MEPENSLVAVVLVGEADTSYSQALGAVHLPQSQQWNSLQQFRSQMTQTIPHLMKRQFSFLTSHGLEIKEALESTIKIKEVITCDKMVKIGLRYQKPKLGIVLDCQPNPDIPLGFLFCDFQCTIQGLFHEMSKQLPSLKQALSTSPFYFLDCNGWPIGKEQEDHLTVLDIVTNNSLKVRWYASNLPEPLLKVYSKEIPESNMKEYRQEIPKSPVKEDRQEIPESPVKENRQEIPESPVKEDRQEIPESPVKEDRQEIPESHTGKPSIVISCHEALPDTFLQEMVQELKGKKYGVWSLSDVPVTDEEKAIEIFQKKVDEASVIIFIISKEFIESSFCKQQVSYYQRTKMKKRIIPLLHGTPALPTWIANLIGISPFISCQAEGYIRTLMKRVEEEHIKSLEEMKKEKEKMTQMCSKISTQLPKGKHIYIAGSTVFYESSVEKFCEELGRELAQDPEVILVTGGFFGVGETVGQSFNEERKQLSKPCGVWHIIAERDDEDKSKKTRQNPDGTFPPVPYGETLFVGDSVRERETVTPRVLNLCVLIAGGPGAAHEAHGFLSNKKDVIAVKVTGGAAGGDYNLPNTIFQKPTGVAESDWALLGDRNAKPVEIARAVVRITQVLLLKSGSIAYKRSNTEPGSKDPAAKGGTKKRQLGHQDTV